MSEGQTDMLNEAMKHLSEQVEGLTAAMKHMDTVFRGDGVVPGMADNVRRALGMLEEMRATQQEQGRRVQELEASRANFEAIVTGRLTAHEHQVEARLVAIENKHVVEVAALAAAPDKAIVQEGKVLARTLLGLAVVTIVGLAAYGWEARQRAEHPKAPPGAPSTR